MNTKRRRGKSKSIQENIIEFVVTGDDIKMNSGNLYVNDVLISNSNTVVPNQQYTLNTNEYFVVGDNENNSFDSRHHGPLLLEEIEGNVITNK